MIRTAELKTADPAPTAPTRPGPRPHRGPHQRPRQGSCKGRCRGLPREAVRTMREAPGCRTRYPYRRAPSPRGGCGAAVSREHTAAQAQHHVAHDRGKRHCITWCIEANRDPAHQALDEILEETGLRLVDLSGLTAGPVLNLPTAMAVVGRSTRSSPTPISGVCGSTGSTSLTGGPTLPTATLGLTSRMASRCRGNLRSPQPRSRPDVSAN